MAPTVLPTHTAHLWQFPAAVGGCWPLVGTSVGYRV